MGAVIDDPEAVFLIWYHRNVRNRLGCAGVGSIAAVVDAHAVHKE